MRIYTINWTDPPTDSNLLLDAMRSIINGITKLCDKHGVQGWRQSAYRIKSLKCVIYTPCYHLVVR